MNLIIVESPTKAKTLSRFLSNGYDVLSTMGHIRDLPKNELGVDVEHDFKPQYVTVKGRSEQIKKIKEKAKTVNSVILATDPDREGEAIAHHVFRVVRSNSKLKTQNSKFKRIVFHEITRSAIREALNNPREIDMQLVNAQQARRILDRLVGYKLSPLLWYKIRKGLSAGRVQSVAVRLIVEREREIEAFKPQEYWVIEALLRKNATEGQAELQTDSFLAKLIKKEGKKYEVKDKKKADQVVADLKKASYVVGKVKKKQVRRFPYPPFTTSTMQQTASNVYGWTAKKTMQLAQRLYEEGYITYHRTDSTSISKEAYKEVRNFIPTMWGKEYLPDKPRIYKTKSKVAQEAHEAIRPTDVKVVVNRLEKDVELKSLPKELGREAGRLYSLIWKRFLASQMKEAIYDQTNVDVKADSYGLRATGSILQFDGWKVIYGEKTQSQNLKIKKNQNRDIEDKLLPPLEVGELLNLLKLLPQQKFTQPPPRYNEASLIKALEKLGIGRPSTYAPIISTIQSRQYVERVDRRFEPTSLGVAVNDFLVKHFPDIVDFDFTANMEDQLDDIANGQRKWVPTIRDFYEPFESHLSKVYKQAKRVKVETEKIGEDCPKCGNPLVVRIGRYGKFIACSTYPECKYSKPYVEKAGVVCPKCGGDVIIKKTKRGKRFYGCSSYPKCKFASWTKPKK